MENIDIEELETILYSQVFHGYAERMIEENGENDVSILNIETNSQGTTCSLMQGQRYFKRYFQDGARGSSERKEDSAKKSQISKTHPNSTIITCDTTGSPIINQITINQYTYPPLLVNPEIAPPEQKKKVTKTRKGRKTKRKAPETKVQAKKTTKAMNTRKITKEDEVICLSDSDAEDCVVVMSTTQDKNISKKPSKASIIIETSDVDAQDSDENDDIIYIEPPPVPVINVDPDSESENVSPETSNIGQESELICSLDASNDFLDEENSEMIPDKFSFTLHSDFVKPGNPSEAYETSESSISEQREFNNSVKTIVFNEVEFPQADLFSETNLESFGLFITPKKVDNSLVTNKSKGKHGRDNESSEDSSSESDYNPEELASNKNGKGCRSTNSKSLPILSPMHEPNNQSSEIAKPKKSKKKSIEKVSKGKEKEVAVSSVVKEKSAKGKEKSKKSSLSEKTEENTNDIHKNLKIKKKQKKQSKDLPSSDTRNIDDVSESNKSANVASASSSKAASNKKRSSKSYQSDEDIDNTNYTNNHTSLSGNKKRKKPSEQENNYNENLMTQVDIDLPDEKEVQLLRSKDGTSEVDSDVPENKKEQLLRCKEDTLVDDHLVEKHCSSSFSEKTEGNTGDTQKNLKMKKKQKKQSKVLSSTDTQDIDVSESNKSADVASTGSRKVVSNKKRSSRSYQSDEDPDSINYTDNDTSLSNNKKKKKSSEQKNNNYNENNMAEEDDKTDQLFRSKNDTLEVDSNLPLADDNLAEKHCSEETTIDENVNNTDPQVNIVVAGDAILDDSNALVPLNDIAKSIELIVVDEVSSDREIEIVDNDSSSDEDFRTLDDVGNELKLVNTSLFVEAVLEGTDGNIDYSNFDVANLQQNMTDDPNFWQVSFKDRAQLYGIKQKKGPRCMRCRQKGHTAFRCPNKPEIPSCHLCGREGHSEPSCPNRVCLQCASRGSSSTTFCWKCADYRKSICTVCNTMGHNINVCPDLWRRYHSTTTPGPIISYGGPQLKPREEQWCAGCAQQGHLDFECNSYRYNREYPAVSPAVFEYSDVYHISTNDYPISTPTVNNNTSIINPFSLIRHIPNQQIQENFVQENRSIFQLQYREGMSPDMSASPPQQVLNPFSIFNTSESSQLGSSNRIAEMTYDTSNDTVVSPSVFRNYSMLFTNGSIPQLQDFIRGELTKLGGMNYGVRYLKTKYYTIQHLSKKTHTSSFMPKKLLKRIADFYKRLNMFIFGVNLFKNGKKNLDYLRNFLALTPSNKLGLNKRDNLRSAYEYIFGGVAHEDIDYNKVLSFIQFNKTRKGKHLM